MLKRQLLELEIDKIYPNDYNANRMTPDLFNRLVEDIKYNGLLNPIHVYAEKPDKYIIIDGEHRYRAFKVLGFKTILAFVYEGVEDEDFKRILSLRFNVLHGTIDPARLVEEYKDLINKYGIEGFGDIIGFNEEVWKQLKEKVVKLLYDIGVPKEVVKQSIKKMSKKKTLDQIVRIVDEILKNFSSLEKVGFVSVSDGIDFIYIALDKKTYNDFSAFLGKLASVGISSAELIKKIVDLDVDFWVKNDFSF